MTSSRTQLWSALLLLTACAGDGGPNADPPELHDLDRAPPSIRQAALAVVRIQHPAGSAGTGSFISADGLLMTNEHVLGGEVCAREGCAVSLSFQHQRGELSLPARDVFAVPQHVDVGLDMAVVQIFEDEAKTRPLVTPNFLTFAPRSAEDLIGEHVTAIGHPLGRLKKWSSGYVVDADGEWFDTSAFSLPGSSGSPVVNDQGLVVGLLHRGAEGFDLLTPTSTQVTTVASASADLQRALSTPLPPSVFSLRDALSVEQVLSRTAAFLAASAWTANLQGQQTSIVSLLGAECDKGLARDDYTSIEQLQAALSPCWTALDFIECRTDVLEEAKTTPKECPTAERAVWQRRLQAVSDKQQQFNGSLDLSSLSYSMEVLADSQINAEQTARTNLGTALDRTRPKLDFTIGSYLAAYGVVSYQGQSVPDFFLRYAQQPFYERYAWQVCTSALWLYGAKLLKRDQALAIAQHLYRDHNVNIGAKLRIEEVLYNADEL